MKKDLIFAPVLLLLGIALCLLRVTGMTAHIAVSVVGVLVLVAYTVLTKKEWKVLALELDMRICYGVALISGAIVMNVHATALSIIHKVSALLFLASLIALLVVKAVLKKKNKNS